MSVIIRIIVFTWYNLILIFKKTTKAEYILYIVDKTSAVNVTFLKYVCLK